MKKLSLKQFDLGSTEVLSREEMKKVLGGFEDPLGGTCRFHYQDGPYVMISDCMNKSDAMSGASNTGGMWCCDSCGSAGWGAC